jgi:hypothetical protein
LGLTCQRSVAFTKNMNLCAGMKTAINYNVTRLEKSENIVNLHIEIIFGKEKYTLKLLNYKTPQLKQGKLCARKK